MTAATRRPATRHLPAACPCRACRTPRTPPVLRRASGWISGGVTVSRRGKVAFVVLAAAGAGTLAYAVAVGQVITCLGVFAIATAVQALVDRLAGR